MHRLFLFLFFFIPLAQFRAGGDADSLRSLLDKSPSESSKAGIELLLSETLAKNECNKAKEYALAALTYYKQAGDEPNQAKALERCAGACTFASDFEQAIAYNMQALSMYEKFNDKKSVSYIRNKLGLVYYQLGDYKKALDYYQEAMLFYKETNDREGEAFLLNNIGNIYEKEKKYDSALANFQGSLTMKEELKDQQGMAVSINNIGNIYFDKEEYPRAVAYWKQSLDIKEKLNDKPGISNTLQNIGYGYFYMKHYDEAIDWINRGLHLAMGINNKHYIKEAYVKLSDVYQEMKNFEKALEYTQLYGAMKDTLYNENSSRQIAEMETKYQTEQKEKTLQLQKLELNKKQIVIYFAGTGLALMLLLAFFIYRGYRLKKRAHLLISLQKEEVVKQKHMVEEKNREMLDSINYARRIQDALLKEEEHVTAHLPAHFILYKAKDIVSGDFYWGAEKKGHWFLAVADCTGHGVPGAFMSMLGIAYLNEINSGDVLLTPAGILNKLREKIVKELKQTGHAGESKDGMDISILRLNLATNEVQWAGANNPLYWIHQGVLSEYKGDKQPIGFSYNPTPFTNHSIRPADGDQLYLFSDGFADQFGGPKGKKFKYKQLQHTLLDINTLSLSSQKEYLGKCLDSWKGNLEQVDDITLIGIRI
ncbi:MAG TPA: tetratricopeptide repeat protein [Bacteroidia bacterium]|jgi:serine phosphatase RsbU (regulator of sigma subunit)|nr:tetratricopeptide repeat protein [Bacteroidia bacterium]